MAKRIVEETLENGEKQYRVETDRWFFGLLKCDWYTDSVYLGYPYDTTCNAVFGTLREAQIHCGINPNPVIKREVI